MDTIGNSKFNKHSIFIVTFFIYFGIVISASIEKADNVCTTAECNATAVELAKNIDFDVLPCDNFYNFVCGKLVRDITSRTKAHISSLTEFYLNKSIFREKDERFQQASTLYNLCKVQNANAKGLDFLRYLLTKIGDWPIVEGRNWKENTWENMAGQLSQLNYNSGIFFHTRMAALSFNYDVIVMELMPFNLSIQSAENISQVAIKLGADANTTSAQSFIDTLSHFEYLNNLPKGIYHCRIFTIHQMMMKWPSIDWMTYFTGYFSSNSSIIINAAQRVYVNEKHVDSIVDLLEKTPKSAIINYVIARIVEKLLPYLRPELTGNFGIGLNNHTKDQLHDWNQFCTDITIEQLPKMVHALLYVKYFDEPRQKAFGDAVEILKNKMGELIRQANWLDNETTAVYMERIFDITSGLWNFDRMSIDEYIEEYRNLSLDEQDFYHAMWSIVTFQQNSQYYKVINTTFLAKALLKHREAIKEHINDVDSFYHVDSNRIVVSMGAIVNPFFMYNCPKYTNYGGLGLLLAHEIAHAVSLNAIHDYFNNSSDLNLGIRDEFFHRIDCFFKQYGQITGLEKPLNTTTTLVENIADNVGIKLAYLVYKDWIEKNPLEPKLQDLNYTSKQMFWITLAQNQCIYGEEITDGPDDDFHSPAQIRLNEALRNIPEFSEDFQCSSVSHMNPSKKCILW